MERMNVEEKVSKKFSSMFAEALVAIFSKWLDPETVNDLPIVPKEDCKVYVVTKEVTDSDKLKVVIGFDRYGFAKTVLDLDYLDLATFIAHFTQPFSLPEGDQAFSVIPTEEILYTEKEYMDFRNYNNDLLNEFLDYMTVDDCYFDEGIINIRAIVGDQMYCTGSVNDFKDAFPSPLILPNEQTRFSKKDFVSEQRYKDWVNAAK